MKSGKFGFRPWKGRTFDPSRVGGIYFVVVRVRRFHLISAKITHDTAQVGEPDSGPARRGQQRFRSSVAGHIPVSLPERWPVAPDAGRIGTHATDCPGAASSQ